MLGEDDGISLTAGEYAAEGVRLQIPEFQDPISIPKGRIEFTPIELKFDEVKGFIGKSQFRLNGALKTLQPPVFDRFSVQAVLRERLLSHMFGPSSRLPDVTLDGAVTLQAVLSGLVNAPKLKGELDLLYSGLQLSGVVQKQRGVPGL